MLQAVGVANVAIPEGVISYVETTEKSKQSVLTCVRNLSAVYMTLDAKLFMLVEEVWWYDVPSPSNYMYIMCIVTWGNSGNRTCNILKCTYAKITPASSLDETSFIAFPLQFRSFKQLYLFSLKNIPKWWVCRWWRQWLGFGISLWKLQGLRGYCAKPGTVVSTWMMTIATGFHHSLWRVWAVRR